MRPRAPIIPAARIDPTLLLEHLRPEHEIGDAGFVFDGDEQHALLADPGSRATSATAVWADVRMSFETTELVICSLYVLFSQKSQTDSSQIAPCEKWR